MMNVLISTGGSGGHVIPATILHEHLKNEFNIFISSDKRGVEFLDNSKVNIEIIDVPKISKNIFILPFQIILIFFLTLKSLFFLKKNKIKIIISTGGYMSLPLCVASKILNLKLFLFEPNMVLGRMNNLFINSCKKIFCYSENIKNFPKELKKNISVIPTLLRKEFYSSKIISDINEEIKLLVIGGSQGAMIFDKIIQDPVLELSKKYKLKIFHQTNSKNFNSLKNYYLKNNIESELFDFNDNVLKFMNESNICITRAGASTLAELVFLNIAHIAIPLPSAKDNHQFENALFY
tara:strand:- start:299 stop:1177 length:879 start_codon:yes stop_codon:yes gene_type:complete